MDKWLPENLGDLPEGEKWLKDMTPEELFARVNKLARGVEALMPPGPSNKGKALFMVVFTDTCGPGEAQYASNATRPECIKWLRETADRLERGQTYNTELDRG